MRGCGQLQHQGAPASRRERVGVSRGIATLSLMETWRVSQGAWGRAGFQTPTALPQHCQPSSAPPPAPASRPLPLPLLFHYGCVPGPVLGPHVPCPQRSPFQPWALGASMASVRAISLAPVAGRGGQSPKPGVWGLGRACLSSHVTSKSCSHSGLRFFAVQGWRGLVWT